MKMQQANPPDREWLRLRSCGDSRKVSVTCHASHLKNPATSFAENHGVIIA
jgi:hypothetical protein